MTRRPFPCTVVRSAATRRNGGVDKWSEGEEKGQGGHVQLPIGYAIANAFSSSCTHVRHVHRL